MSEKKQPEKRGDVQTQEARENREQTEKRFQEEQQKPATHQVSDTSKTK
jgi:hypothetical protein